jgi:uncharacterized protein
VPTRYSASRVDAAERTTGGLLRVTAAPTRAGVFEYTSPSGEKFSELRHPDEVFHPDSLASLEDVPVTLAHPKGGMKPELFSKLAVGHVRAGTVQRGDGDVVRSAIVLSRADAIAMAEKPGPKPDLSAGYDCVIDPTPGVYMGQRYDQAQTRIRYHHVMMLPSGQGRAGTVCRLDSAGEEIPPGEDSPSLTEEPPMKITIGDKVYEGEATIQAEITKLVARADAAEATARKLSETVARADAAAALAAREGLVAKVQGVLGKDFPLVRKGADGKDVPLTDRELRVAVIKRADSKFSDADRDDVYVEARFDATLATSSKATSVIEALNLGALPVGGGTGGGAEQRADKADDSGARAAVKATLEKARKAGVSVAE